MVAKTNKETEIAASVEQIYCRITILRAENPQKSGKCDACGKCCDFETFDHRLFVTTPELIYLTEKIGPQNIRPMNTGRCPYNIDGQCNIYQHRFTGCRIFSCNADPDSQSQLTESTLKELKAICEKFDIDCRYTDLKTALNTL